LVLRIDLAKTRSLVAEDIRVDEVPLLLGKQLGFTEVVEGVREEVELVLVVHNTATTRVLEEEGEQGEVVFISQGGHSQRRSL